MIVLHFRVQGVNLKCKNCTVTGGIEISQGKFSIGGGGGLADAITDPVEFFKSGSVEVAMSSFSVHIEISISIDKTKNLLDLVVPFPDIPLAAFAVSRELFMLLSPSPVQFTSPRCTVTDC